jgi:hypothetical protein
MFQLEICFIVCKRVTCFLFFRSGTPPPPQKQSQGDERRQLPLSPRGHSPAALSVSTANIAVLLPRPLRRPLLCHGRPAATCTAAVQVANLSPCPQRRPPLPSHCVVHGNDPMAVLGIVRGRGLPIAFSGAAAPLSCSASSMASPPPRAPCPTASPVALSAAAAFAVPRCRQRAKPSWLPCSLVNNSSPCAIVRRHP